MSYWLLRARRMRPQLFAVLLLATLAHGAEPTTNTAAVLIEKLCNKTDIKPELQQACGELEKLKPMIPGLSDENLLQLELYLATQRLADFDHASAEAQQAALEVTWLSRASKGWSPKPLKLDPKEHKAEHKTLEDMLKTARKQFPSGPSAIEWNPEPKMLLDAADALIKNGQLKDASFVLDRVKSAEPGDLAQVALRRGILLMKQNPPNESAARAVFQGILKDNPNASLPDCASKEERRIFEEIKAPVIVENPDAHKVPIVDPVDPLKNPTRPPVNPPLNGQQVWGLATGGAGLVLLAVGTGTGLVAYSTSGAEAEAAMNGNQSEFERLRSAARAQSTIADVFSSAGAIALGAGACLYFLAPRDGNNPPPSQIKPSLGIGMGKGQMSLVVGGHF